MRHAERGAMTAGRCMCGAVTVEAVPAEPGMHACHCDMCRRWTGSVLMAFMVRDGDLTARGPVRTMQSSDWAERAWCDECGSALWYRITADGPMKGEYHVAAGLFDDSAGRTLDLEFYIDRKPDGFGFTGAHERLTEAEVEAMIASSVEGGHS